MSTLRNKKFKFTFFVAENWAPYCTSRGSLLFPFGTERKNFFPFAKLSSFQSLIGQKQFWEINVQMVSANRPRSIYQYSSMAPRLSGKNCKFFKVLLSLNSQRRLRYKENNTKYRSLTWKPRSHVRILIYRTWPIRSVGFLILVKPLPLVNGRPNWFIPTNGKPRMNNIASRDRFKPIRIRENLVVNYLTIRPVALKGYGPIAHSASPHGLLARGPWERRV